jgi:hypothetical protein
MAGRASGDGVGVIMLLLPSCCGDDGDLMKQKGTFQKMRPNDSVPFSQTRTGRKEDYRIGAFGPRNYE